VILVVLELRVHPELPGPWDRRVLLVRMARAALRVIRGLPVSPDRTELLACLDLLGRVVRLAEREIQVKEGPLERLALRDPKELQALRARLANRDLAVRLDLLGLLVMEDPLDLPGIRALALLVQRDLLELDPPDLPVAPDLKDLPERREIPVPLRPVRQDLRETPD
jgi:hypothetical protein